MALKENAYIQNYDDMNYIHNYFTGLNCPDISNIEIDLLDDFDKFIDKYNETNWGRSNLINGQFLLFKLLKRRGKNVNIKELC